MTEIVFRTFCEKRWTSWETYYLETHTFCVFKLYLLTPFSFRVTWFYFQNVTDNICFTQTHRFAQLHFPRSNLHTGTINNKIMCLYFRGLYYTFLYRFAVLVLILKFFARVSTCCVRMHFLIMANHRPKHVGNYVCIQINILQVCSVLRSC